MTFVLVILAFIIIAFSFKIHVFAGIAAMVVFLSIGIYNFMPTIYKLKSRKYLYDGEYIKAKEILKKSAEKPTARAELKMEYAYVLMRAGEFEDAERMYNNILAQKTDDGVRKRAIVQRSLCYYKMGNFEEAYSDANELYESGYKSMNIYALLGLLKIVKAPKAQDTYDFCSEAYDYADDERDICDNMIICHYNRGEYYKAKEISDRILKDNPKFVEAWYHGAQIDVAMGDFEAANEKMEKIEYCTRSSMTTVSEQAILDLKNEINNKLGVNEDDNSSC